MRHGLTPVVVFVVVTYSYHSCESFVSIYLRLELSGTEFDHL